MSSTKRDYYEVLGVGKGADAEDIKRAYRKLAMQYHPDRNPGDEEAEALFKEASEAYGVLSDPDKRARYDRYGHAGLDGLGGGPQFTDVHSIFDLFGDIFGGGFGDLFGNRGGRGGRTARGQNLQIQLEIDLVDAANGVTRTLEFERSEMCGDCGGGGARRGSRPARCNRCQGRGVVIQRQGFFQVQITCSGCGGRGEVITDPCPTCRGSGQVQVRRTLEVNVPAGVDHGNQIRLAGEGEVSSPGGPRGDLFCLIRVKPHPLFERDGHDLHCVVPLTFSQAALGGDIEVPTLTGRHKVAVERGAGHGDTIRLRHMGMPDLRGRGRGDLVVHLRIETPRKLTKRQEELFRELAELDHKHVSPERKSWMDRVKEWFTATETPAEAKPEPPEAQPAESK